MPDEGSVDETVDTIEPIEIQEEMERSFLDYAMSVITARALPDARDGLKPVHRRILYGMYEGGLRPDRPHRKSASAVGDVMGKYHPHGDSAIYDALARMAQDFSLRYPLVDGHGNFGSPDPNDRPAAMRYCVVGDTRVRTTEGTYRIRDLADVDASSATAIDVKVLDHRGGPVRAVTLFHSGEHPTLRMRTREGYEIAGTANHPVLGLVSVAGVPLLQWRLLEEIEPGDYVVVSRQVTAVTSGEAPTGAEASLALVAGAIAAEGWISEARSGFDNVDPEYLGAVLDAYDRTVGGRRQVSRRVVATRSELWELYIKNLTGLSDSPLAEMAGPCVARTRVPELVWRGSADTKRVFLQALFEGGGSSSLLPRETIQISYSTRSRQLASDVQRLLLEFGVVSRRVSYASGEIKLVITDRRDAELFERNVGFLGAKQEKLTGQLDAIPVRSRSRSHDSVPFLASFLRGEVPDPWLRNNDVDSTGRWEASGSEILAHIDSHEAKGIVAPLVASGYYYAQVDAVEPAGTQDVYSVRVDSDAHSFLAGGFVNHNTEARLAPLAMKMLGEIDEETVDATDTYDGQNTEPVVLPARFPNLLVNGVSGIAVGMSTSIPPHNLREVIDAATHLIDHPDATPDDLMAFVKGPDFPTGARLLGRAGLEEVYRTGRGSVTVRAVAEIEEGPRDLQRIVVSEVPYQKSVEMIGQKIAELVNDREIDGVRDVRNESSGDTVRLVIDLKKDANAQVVLNQLYKRTAMQDSFAVHMLALVEGVPRQLDLATALSVYVGHQIDVVTRRSRHRLDVARRRLHIVEGLIRALDHIDAIVALIRGSEDAAAARESLMGEPFSFSEVQATHILDMQLRRLAQLEGQKLRDEHAELEATIAALEKILADEAEMRSVIKEELSSIRSEFGDERRTQVVFDPGDIDTLDLIEDEEVIVVLSHKGYVKTVAADAFRTQGRGGRGVTGAKLRDEDYVEHLLLTTAHSYLLFFSDRGRVYRIRAHEIPMKDRTARGTALVNLLALQPGERVQAIIDTRTYEDGAYLFFATKLGVVKKTRMSEYDSSLRAGLIAINLRDDDELVRVVQTSGTDDIFMVSRGGSTIRFSEEDVRPMGRATAGVRGMRLKDADDAVVSCDVARDDTVMFFVTGGGFGKRTRLGAFNQQGRGGQGVRGMRVTEERGPVVAAFTVGGEDEILVFSSAGNVIRTPVSEVSEQGRGATGVRVSSVAPGDTVVAVARVLEAEAVATVAETDGDGEEH